MTRRRGRDEAAWARDLVERHVRDGTSPDDHEVARLLRGMLEPAVRDAAWAPITRETSREHVRLWADVLRRGPDPAGRGARGAAGLRRLAVGPGRARVVRARPVRRGGRAATRSPV